MIIPSSSRAYDSPGAAIVTNRLAGGHFLALSTSFSVFA